jgi:uncharacterized glyoxalase superfamily protein PhnB
MTDPFEALREPVRPADPDPEFAGRLRTRLTREIFASPGGTMSQQTTQTRVEREPAPAPALTPYIVVSDARRAMDWYVEVFGAQRRGELYVNADGTIGHAEVGIGDAVLMFSEASGLWPDVPVRAPDSPATFSHSLHLEVDDVDASTERARRGGASVEREPADQPYGRAAVIVDPFGHRWILLRSPARQLRQGDVANVTMAARDAERAKEFYQAVLQVPFSAGHPGTWRTEVTRPPLGIRSSEGAEPEVQLSYRVDDIAAAGPGGRRPGGRARAQALRAVRRVRRRPGRDVPPLAAGRLTAASRGFGQARCVSRPRAGPVEGLQAAVGAELVAHPRHLGARTQRRGPWVTSRERHGHEHLAPAGSHLAWGCTTARSGQCLSSVTGSSTVSTVPGLARL